MTDTKIIDYLVHICVQFIAKKTVNIDYFTAKYLEKN